MATRNLRKRNFIRAPNTVLLDYMYDYLHGDTHTAQYRNCMFYAAYAYGGVISHKPVRSYDISPVRYILINRPV